MNIGRVLLPFCAVALVGCSETNRTSQTAKPSTPSAATTAPANHDAANTERNQRDRGGATMTPTDQSESKSDLKITQEIRKALVADKELSVNAHNVKVITVDGTVTLRGPVDSGAEKSIVAAKAEEVAGATKVVDEMEVKLR